MEADFQRDYGLDLREALDGMSWRRFSVLVRHLSPFGAAAQAVEAVREEGEEHLSPFGAAAQAVEAVREEGEDTQQAAGAFFQSMVGFPDVRETGGSGAGRHPERRRPP